MNPLNCRSWEEINGQNTLNPLLPPLILPRKSKIQHFSLKKKTQKSE